jgi:starch synthase
MRIDLLTKEYPPHIYGGAGVHVAELVRALRETDEVQVRCFGVARTENDVSNYEVPRSLQGADAVIQTLATDVAMANDVGGAQVVHSHTWYANEAGRLAQLLWGIPHVITAHSLEPLRPWKAEQLGGGYRVSSDIEKRAYLSADAVIAVSAGMRKDILAAYPDIDPEKVFVVHNGIDSQTWHPRHDSELLVRYGINPAQRSVIFVGRITRQKGLPYLLSAVKHLDADVQIILCAGAPDTPEILDEVRAAVVALRQQRQGVIWIEEHLPQRELSALLSASTVFVCPSIYEPLGIVNLEAMACGIPVVGTATGGIPEVVIDGETGWLVPIEQATDGTGTPLDPDRYIADLAETLARAVSDPGRARDMGEAARQRAVDHFDWRSIAEQTRAIYARVSAH